MENGVDIFRVARCLLMISLVTILVNYAKRFNNGRNFIEQTILFLCISFIITLLGANIIGSEIFKSLISIVSSLNTPNYLTQDQYGYRLSGFFHEPSQASIVFGTSLACLAYMRSKIRWFLVLTVLAILYFFMSRSLTILVIFLVCLILLNTPRIFSVIFICTLFGFQTIISVFHNQILPTGLIRSIYERAFASQFEIADWRNFLFGTDFGEVYSFEPIWGIHLQVGYIGLIALYFILQRDVRAYAFAVTCFTIAPHLWFAPSWFALAIFLIGSDRSVRAQLSK
ncbi:hypothetical protein RBLE17_18250 [Rhodobacteraceae bacterium LE17]|nr:hypothetical protein [Rhodobacteraceae bacterium LE17]